MVVTLVGAGLLTVPLWLRLWRALGAERAARIRNDEREEIASHLHDSVLQTLALIQKQADHPQEVARLARGQERELRKWLFGGGDADHSSLAEALRIIAGEVEDHHGVTVRPVTVGDVPLDVDDTGEGLSKESFTAVLGATRRLWSTPPSIPGRRTSTCSPKRSPNRSVCSSGTAASDSTSTRCPRTVRAWRSRSGDGSSGEAGRRRAVRAGKGTEVRIHMPRNGRTWAAAGASEDSDTAGVEDVPFSQGA